MADSECPWEPPFAGTETEHLVGSLDRLRTTFRWKAGDLDAPGLQTRIGASSLTLGGLLKHLAFVEDFTFTVKMRGGSPGVPWESVDWDARPDWDSDSAADDTPEELYALWDAAVERSSKRLAEAVSGGGLDQLVDVSSPDGEHASLRRLVFDLVEEYGRHTGHAPKEDTARHGGGARAGLTTTFQVLSRSRDGSRRSGTVPGRRRPLRRGRAGSPAARRRTRRTRETTSTAGL